MDTPIQRGKIHEIFNKKYPGFRLPEGGIEMAP